MKLDGAPLELIDDLVGDSTSLDALERGARPVRDVPFVMPDSTGDCTDVIAELERAALTEVLTGFAGDRVAGADELRKTAIAPTRKTVSRHQGFVRGLVDGTLGKFFKTSGAAEAREKLITHCVSLVEESVASAR